MKYPYRFQEPKPWDVIVFKNPQDNEQNYIKRLIGLPGETIEIVHGDIFVREPGQKEFHVRRKLRPRTQDAMWQVVFDNDYRPNPALIAKANMAVPTFSGMSNRITPPHWQLADPASPEDARWTLDPNSPNTEFGRLLRFQGAEPGHVATLRLDSYNAETMFMPRYGYDDPIRPELPDVGPWDIVSDLKLEGAWHPDAPGSKLILLLSSFEYRFRAEITGGGEVRLMCQPTEGQGKDQWRPLAAPVKLDPLANGNGHVVSLRNVDLKASVWIDGRQVAASVDEGSPTVDGVMAYPMDYQWVKDRMAQAMSRTNPKDVPLPEVRIAAAGAASQLEHVKLMRDVYYTCPVIREPIGRQPAYDFADREGVRQGMAGWATDGHPISLEKFDNSDLDQFFVLGDNSPRSLDGRLWVQAAPTLKLYDTTGLRGDPNLAVGDPNWPALLEALRRPAASADASAGAYVLSRLSETVRRDVVGLSRSQVTYDSVEDALKRQIVSELNRMMASGELFDAKLWLGWGVVLPEPARKLAEAKDLDEYDRKRLNRMALQAALPGAVTDQWRIYQLGTVPRYSLIGKAIFVYWPSGFQVPGVSGLPIIPNVGRMRLIR